MCSQDTSVLQGICVHIIRIAEQRGEEHVTLDKVLLDMSMAGHSSNIPPGV